MASRRRIGTRRRAARSGSANNLAYVACVVLGFSWLLIHFRNDMPAFTFDLSWLLAQQSSASPQDTKLKLRTGSILLEPADGRICRQRLIDNDTWQIRDNGLVDCAAASAQSAGTWHPERATAIRNSFVHQ